MAQHSPLVQLKFYSIPHIHLVGEAFRLNVARALP